MKRCGTADLKEGMLVTCPHFENSPRVVIGHVYALAGARSRVLPTYRVKLVDPKTGIANSFDFLIHTIASGQCMIKMSLIFQPNKQFAAST